MKKEEVASKMGKEALGWKYAKGLKKNTHYKEEKLKSNQKGRQSLNKPKGEHNEGEHNYLEKNEINRP